MRIEGCKYLISPRQARRVIRTPEMSLEEVVDEICDDYFDGKLTKEQREAEERSALHEYARHLREQSELESN